MGLKGKATKLYSACSLVLISGCADIIGGRVSGSLSFALTSCTRAALALALACTLNNKLLLILDLMLCSGYSKNLASDVQG